MTKEIERRCRECGVGIIRPVSGKGRVARYKNMEVEVPEALKINTCDHCRAEWFDPTAARAFDAAMEEAYQAAISDRVKRLISKVQAAAPMRQVESALGLSEGYLSKVKQGRSQASAQLVAALGLLAGDIRPGLARLQEMWGGQRIVMDSTLLSSAGRGRTPGRAPTSRKKLSGGKRAAT